VAPQEIELAAHELRNGWTDGAEAVHFSSMEQHSSSVYLAPINAQQFAAAWGGVHDGAAQSLHQPRLLDHTWVSVV
jgi:hypothetical protein